jgi:hypothetical protein
MKANNTQSPNIQLLTSLSLATVYRTPLIERRACTTLKPYKKMDIIARHTSKGINNHDFKFPESSQLNIHT